MKFFPLFADLHQKKVLVVGAGKVATRKIEMLMRAGAAITTVAPYACEQITELAQHQQLTWLQKNFQEDDLQACWLVIAATDNPQVNQQVRQA
ncbi:MAG: siroheme synthase-like protein, partial [Pseudohongiellaceae bacterium]